MAEIVEQNPGSNEIQSPLMAGFSAGLNTLSKVLDMEIESIKNLILVNVPIGKEDKNRIYEAPFGSKLWLKSPAIVVKKNGLQIKQVSVPFTVDYLGGSITFQTPLQDQDVVTVDVSFIKPGSTRIKRIETKVEKNKENAERYKGSFSDEKTLSTLVPNGKEGDFAIVSHPALSMFAWNAEKQKWESTQILQSLEDYYNKAAVNKLLAGKEDRITGPVGVESPARKYFSGEKQWEDVGRAVLETTLEGLQEGSGGKITSGDTLIAALSKLQSQASSKKSYLSGSSAPATSLAADVGQRYVNISSGEWYTCTGHSGNSYIWKKGLNAEPGMGLYPIEKPVTDNNFTTAEKQKLAGLENYNDSGLRSMVNNKVSKEPGKGLSSNDFTDEDKRAIAEKVSSVNGVRPVGGNVQLNAASVGALGRSEKASAAGNSDMLGGQFPSYYTPAENVEVLSCTFGLSWAKAGDAWTQEVYCEGVKSSGAVKYSSPWVYHTGVEGTDAELDDSLSLIMEGSLESLRDNYVTAKVYAKPTSEVEIFFRRVVL